MCFTQHQDVASNAQLNIYSNNLNCEFVLYQQDGIVNEEYENVQPNGQPNVQPNVQQVFQPIQAIAVRPTPPIGRSEKPKRYRTKFSDEQLAELENQFKINHYLNGSARNKMADELDLPVNQVKVWFQNRRMKSKREGNSSKGRKLTGKNSVSSSSSPSSSPSSSSSPSYQLDQGWNPTATDVLGMVNINNGPADNDIVYVNFKDAIEANNWLIAQEEEGHFLNI